MENLDYLSATPENPDIEEEKQKRKIAIRDNQLENPRSKTPVMVVPGWGITAESFEGVLGHLKDNGLRARAVENLYGVDDEVLTNFFIKLKDARPEIDIDEIKKKFPKTELKKAAELIEGLDQIRDGQADAEVNDKGKTDCIGVSQGGYIVAIAAYLCPERFRNIVLVDPAGIVGKHSRAKLAIRTSKNARAEQKYADQKKFQGAELAQQNLKIGAEDMKKVLKENFKEAMLDETGAISKADITEILKELRGKGIKIAIIHGVEDKIFPMEKVFDLKEKDEGNLGITEGSKPHLDKESADIFLSTKGTHNQMGLYLGLWMEMVEFALDKLQNLPDQHEGRFEQYEMLKEALDLLRKADHELQKGTRENLQNAWDLSAQADDILYSDQIGDDIKIKTMSSNDALALKAEIDEKIILASELFGLTQESQPSDNSI